MAGGCSGIGAGLTTGLILLTNEGEYCDCVMGPIAIANPPEHKQNSIKKLWMRKGRI
jgi:hypothetical protein